jgi:hypothetical protein
LVFTARGALADGLTKEQCISANESAQDLRRAGHMREARTQLMMCVADTCPGPVREDCATRISEIDAATPSVIFEVRDESDKDLSAVRVTMDGHPLLDKLDGTATRLDTGPHKFEFTADGFRTETRDLVLREGDKNRRERIVLVAPTAAPPSTEAPAAPQETAPAPAPPGAEAHPAGGGDGSTQRMIGLTLGGVGGVGVVVGAIFGIVAKSTFDHAHNSECGPAANYSDSRTCSPQGASDVQSAYGQATVSTVAFIAGAALLAGGASLYLTAPRGAPAVATSVGVGPGGISLRAGW